MWKILIWNFPIILNHQFCVTGSVCSLGGQQYWTENIPKSLEQGVPVTLNRWSWLFLVTWFWNLEFYFHSKFFSTVTQKQARVSLKTGIIWEFFPNGIPVSRKQARRPCHIETGGVGFSPLPHWNKQGSLLVSVGQWRKANFGRNRKLGNIGKQEDCGFFR